MIAKTLGLPVWRMGAVALLASGLVAQNVVVKRQPGVAQFRVDFLRKKQSEPVGQQGAGRAILPVNQRLTPAGKFIQLPGLRPQAAALSPDGQLLAVSGKSSELLILDPDDGAIRQRVKLPSDRQNTPAPAPVSANILKPDTKGQLSFTGLKFSPDGRRIYLSNVNGSIKVFTVAEDASAFTDDYRVFVHFLDADGELMFSDDHAPPTPTMSWRPGQVITYERRTIVPVYPYIGEVTIAIGPAGGCHPDEVAAAPGTITLGGGILRTETAAVVAAALAAACPTGSPDSG